MIKNYLGYEMYLMTELNLKHTYSIVIAKEIWSLKSEKKEEKRQEKTKITWMFGYNFRRNGSKYHDKSVRLYQYL